MTVLVLVDADNLALGRLRLVADALGGVPEEQLHVVVAGSARALEATDWPTQAEVVEAAGWQRADVVLAEAYERYADREGPLVLVTGDGDFSLLASRHGGQVLVISGAASSRLRDKAKVIDPAMVGGEPIKAWLRAVLD